MNNMAGGHDTTTYNESNSVGSRAIGRCVTVPCFLIIIATYKWFNIKNFNNINDNYKLTYTSGNQRFKTLAWAT